MTITMIKKTRIYNRINQNICNHAVHFFLSYYMEEEAGAIKLLLTYIHFTVSSLMKIYCYLFCFDGNSKFFNSKKLVINER